MSTWESALGGAARVSPSWFSDTAKAVEESFQP